MDQLLEQLRWLLNMPVTATVDEVVTELQKAIDQLKGSNPAIATKVDFNLVALVQKPQQRNCLSQNGCQSS